MVRIKLMENGKEIVGRKEIVINNKENRKKYVKLRKQIQKFVKEMELEESEGSEESENEENENEENERSNSKNSNESNEEEGNPSEDDIEMTEYDSEEDSDDDYVPSDDPSDEDTEESVEEDSESDEVLEGSEDEENDNENSNENNEERENSGNNQPPEIVLRIPDDIEAERSTEKNTEEDNKRKRNRELSENEENSVKRQKTDEERWLKEKEKIDKFIGEIEIPDDEMEREETMERINVEIKDIVEIYFKVMKGNSKIIRKWYEIGELIRIKVKQRMLKDERLKNEESVKSAIVKEVTNEIEKEEGVTRRAVNDRLRNALKVYDLFEKIGTEKIGRISNEVKVNTVIKMSLRGIGYVKYHFERMSKVNRKTKLMVNGKIVEECI